MNISLIPLHKNIKHLENEEQLLVKVVAPKNIPEVDAIPPKHICFVIDISGSMTNVFKSVIQSVISGLNKLRDEDYVTVIVYNSTVRILCEWNKCSTVFKNTLKNKMKNLQCMNSTNISGAILKSIEQSMKKPNKKVTTILFTDGRANEGISDMNNLGVILKKLIPENNVLHALGFTAGHNPIFLKKISEVCNQGSYFFIENEDELQCSFTEIIGKTMEVAFQNVKLTLVGDDINFYDVKSEKDFSTLPLSDLHIGESKTCLITTKFTKEHSSYEIKAKIDSFNVIEMQREINFAEIILERGDDNTLNEDVEKRVNILKTSKAVKIASEFAEKSDYRSAEKILYEASKNLKGLPTIKSGLDKLALQCSDEKILNLCPPRLTSYQQSLEVEDDSIFISPPSTVLGISPIKTPKKKVVETFFPNSDDDEVIIQNSTSSCLKEIENPFSFDSNSSDIPQSEVSNTIELTKEE